MTNFKNVDVLKKQLDAIYGEGNYNLQAHLDEIETKIAEQGVEGIGEYENVAFIDGQKHINHISFSVERNYDEENDEYEENVSF